MAARKYPIVQGEIYHVYNRSIAREQIFLSSKDYQRAIETFKFYQFGKSSLRFSHYNRLLPEQKSKFLAQLTKNSTPTVDIICFCLMPNHLHFLLSNLTDGGINNFMRYFQNSYAKYFNLKRGRDGSLFQQNFKAVRIETDEQLVHVSRYIHLNPITSYIVKKIEYLKNYLWSSYPNYLSRSNSYINKKLILDHFRSVRDYQRFVFDQVDYQRELDKIKHLIIE